SSILGPRQQGQVQSCETHAQFWFKLGQVAPCFSISQRVSPDQRPSRLGNKASISSSYAEAMSATRKLKLRHSIPFSSKLPRFRGQPLHPYVRFGKKGRGCRLMAE